MKKIFTLFFLTITTYVFSQDLYLIKFSDKPSADTYLDNPLLMLSQKSLDRRAKYNIDLDITDVPVEQTYVDQVTSLGIEPIAVSKWFNGIFAWLTDAQVSQVEDLSFVSEAASFVNQTGGKLSNFDYSKFDMPQSMPETQNSVFDFIYGWTETQVTQLNLDYLHNLGFTGDGMTIAVMDNGFPGVDTEDGFAYLRDNGKIKGGYNFIDDNEEFYERGTHGTVVLSTMGGYVENEFVGTAIDADYYLFITENTDHELPDEEVNWIEAAERADSIGVDVFNTSLGYSEFDDARYDYTYDDMDGQTAYISRGAQFAAEKGIYVVNSAGNSGGSEWNYITAPADAEGVFTIGAVDSDGNPAYFSSYGPTSDGRIKPDVDALGYGASVIEPDGSFDTSSGTSFSSPIMAGAMACFVQAFPEVHPEELKQAVRMSANLYPNPTDQMGYGIPDFGEAYTDQMSVDDISTQSTITVYPNPTSNYINIQTLDAIKEVQIISTEGKIVRKLGSVSKVDLSSFPNGIYIIKVQLENGKMEVKKLIKK